MSFSCLAVPSEVKELEVSTGGSVQELPAATFSAIAKLRGPKGDGISTKVKWYKKRFLSTSLPLLQPVLSLPVVYPRPQQKIK
jgi:hypothetical protein